MPKPKSSTALVVLSDSELHYPQEQLPKLQAAALQQLALIDSLQREAAARAIMAGLTFHRVKMSMKHGTFLAWIKNNIASRGYRQCNYYMRLASVFVETAEVSKPDILALPGDQVQLALDGAEGQAREFYTKLGQFVGDDSINELLDKHGIKSSGRLGGDRGDDNADEASKSNVPADPEVLRLQSQEEISSTWQRARTLLIGENRLQYFVGKPNELNAIVKGFRELADEIEAAAKPLLSNAS